MKNRGRSGGGLGAGVSLVAQGSGSVGSPPSGIACGAAIPAPEVIRFAPGKFE